MSDLAAEGDRLRDLEAELAQALRERDDHLRSLHDMGEALVALRARCATAEARAEAAEDYVMNWSAWSEPRRRAAMRAIHAAHEAAHAAAVEARHE